VTVRCLLYTVYVTGRSFCPYWQLLRTFTEKTANVHQQLVTSWQDQFRDVQKYAVEQQKTHKEVIAGYLLNLSSHINHDNI